MAKLISQNALILRHQFQRQNYLLTSYANQNFHNAFTVTFETGEEYIVGFRQKDEIIEIFQDIDFFGGPEPSLKLTLADGPKIFPLNDERILNENFNLRPIESKCHVLEYPESDLPEKNWQTRSVTRK
ncbi:hypothetical protein CL684_01940 [Candidatus Campbellbacteria bacterium]|nr:hypothetical protein [Candidatus Campbellbacteria bacterium]|tara:strand:+ start:269 stop:652 length:384 start_codon:yes stop_codon:yes gene_type:complete